MDNKVVNNHEEAITSSNEDKLQVAINNMVNVDLLDSIKNFMDDLSNVTTNKNFIDYHTIVKRIDETKVKSYNKLVDGFKNFFETNNEALINENFDSLIDPNISYVTESGGFSFNFQQIFQEVKEDDQDIIKDHLNHIWNILFNNNKSAEELYIDKIFRNLQSRFSPDLTSEEQMSIVKELCNDFQKQKLDISIVIAIACKKARTILQNSNDPDDNSKMLIDAVEEIDINNFSMVQFMGLVDKIGALFANGDNNPLNGLLSSMFANNLPIDQINLNDIENDQ